MSLLLTKETSNYYKAWLAGNNSSEFPVLIQLHQVAVWLVPVIIGCGFLIIFTNKNLNVLNFLLFLYIVDYVVLLCVFMLWVPYWDVRYDFRIKKSCLLVVVSGTYCVVFSPSSCVPCCQFLWIVHFWLSLRYYLFSNW